MERIEMQSPRQVLLDYVRAHRHAIQLLGILSLVTYGFLAFNLTLAGDDWYLVRNPSVELDTYIPVGRWLRPVIVRAFFGGRFAPAFTLFAWVALMMMGAVLLARVAGARRPAELFLFSALLIFNPVLAELANFKHSHLMIGIGFVCAAGSVYLLHDFVGSGARWSQEWHRRVGAAGLLLVASLGVQQSFILFVFMFFTASTIGILAVGDSAPIRSSALRAFGLYTSVCAAAVAVYFIVTKSLQAYFDMPLFEADYALESSLVRNFQELGYSLGRFRRHITVFLFSEQHLWPQTAKTLFLGVLVMYFSMLGKKVWSFRREGVRTLLTKSVALAVLLVALLVTPWALGLVRLPFSYRYNGLLGLIPFYPIVVVQTLAMVKGRVARYGVILAAAFIVVAFSYFQNVAALATYTTNQRDHFTAESILTRIENHEGFRSLSGFDTIEVVFVGRLAQENEWPFNDFLPGVDMGDSIVNCGVFNCQTNRIPELMAFVAYPTPRRRYRAWSAGLLASLGQSEKTRILDRIVRANAWPDYEAIQILENRVFVILSSPADVKELLKDDSRI
jgi:hypothetical protein